MDDRPNPQLAHYTAVHDRYEQHYYDPTSMAYRREFIYGPLFAGIDLNGKHVAEIACGSGHNSVELRERYPSASFEGFDISPSACAAYREKIGTCHQVDFTKPLTIERSFDAAVIIGGLHHFVNDLPAALRNLASIVKPGGTVFMGEPNARCGLERVRKLWYRLDPSFEADTEHALDPRTLAAMAPDFSVEMVRYIGGPAFFLILNSMILRVPLGAKRYVAPPSLAVERLWSKFNWPPMQAFFLARWRRR